MSVFIMRNTSGWLDGPLTKWCSLGVCLSSSCQDAPPPTCCRRGRSPTVLEGLRRRISSLFLSYIEAPEFNSEARRLKVVGPGQQQQFKYGQAGRATARAAQA